MKFKILMVIAVIGLLAISLVSAGAFNFITGHAARGVSSIATTGLDADGDGCKDTTGCNLRKALYGNCPAKCQVGDAIPELSLDCDEALGICNYNLDAARDDLEACEDVVPECPECNKYCIGDENIDFVTDIFHYRILDPRVHGANDEVTLYNAEDAMYYYFEIDDELDAGDVDGIIPGQTSIDVVYIHSPVAEPFILESTDYDFTDIVDNVTAGSIWLYADSDIGESLIANNNILDASVYYVDVFYTVPYGQGVMWAGTMGVDMADQKKVVAFSPNGGELTTYHAGSQSVTFQFDNLLMEWSVDGQGIASLGETADLADECELKLVP